MLSFENLSEMQLFRHGARRPSGDHMRPARVSLGRRLQQDLDRLLKGRLEVCCRPLHHGPGRAGPACPRGIWRRWSAKAPRLNSHAASTGGQTPRDRTSRSAGCPYTSFPRSRLRRVRPRTSRSHRRHTNRRGHRRTAWHPPSSDLLPAHRRRAVRGQDLRPQHRAVRGGAGEFVPVYDAARSVVDATRHRNRIGHTLALGALGRYLRTSGPDGVGNLQHIARQLHALSVIQPAVEAVLA